MKITQIRKNRIRKEPAMALLELENVTVSFASRNGQPPSWPWTG